MHALFRIEKIIQIKHPSTAHSAKKVQRKITHKRKSIKKTNGQLNPKT